MIAARLYGFLVRLHPRSFRERFGPEMLCDFEEVGSPGRPALIADCTVSLARQWLLRSGYWKIAAAGLGAVGHRRREIAYGKLSHSGAIQLPSRQAK